eukprot:3958022-Prymnesium_polylepis.1
MKRPTHEIAGLHPPERQHDPPVCIRRTINIIFVSPRGTRLCVFTPPTVRYLHTSSTRQVLTSLRARHQRHGARGVRPSLFRRRADPPAARNGLRARAPRGARPRRAAPGAALAA